MKLLVLSLAFALVLSQVKGDKPVWADEAANGANQDAWESIKGALYEIYGMVSATYMDDPVFGQNFTCLILAADDFNEENKSIEGYFMYLNNDGADGHYETVTAVKEYGYNKENALNYKTKDGREYTDIVAFSDEGCYVTYIPGTDGRTEGYELWTNEYKGFKETCLEKFNEYAAGKEVRSVYPDECLNH